MKSYTDLEQSKKLAEVLPLGSADMHYSKDFDGSWFVDLAKYTSVKIPKYVVNVEEHLLPCWSLSALLEQLEGRNFVKLEIKYDDGQYYLFYVDDRGSIDMKTKHYNNLIDACYEMIIKLHEQNLL